MLSTVKYTSQGIGLTAVVIIGGLVLGNVLVELPILNNSNNNFLLLKNPPSTEGTGNLVVYDAIVRDMLSRRSYEVYIGLNWITKNENVTKYSCYLERYTDELLNYTTDSSISSTMKLSYKWDSDKYNNSFYSPVVWTKLTNVQTRKSSINYLIITNWTYNAIIDHDSEIYTDLNWFWFASPEALGEDFAGAITLKFELKTNFS